MKEQLAKAFDKNGNIYIIRRRDYFPGRHIEIISVYSGPIRSTIYYTEIVSCYAI